MQVAGGDQQRKASYQLGTCRQVPRLRGLDLGAVQAVEVRPRLPGRMARTAARSSCLRFKLTIVFLFPSSVIWLGTIA